jgi:hypothetical protein
MALLAVVPVSSRSVVSGAPVEVTVQPGGGGPWWLTALIAVIAGVAGYYGPAIVRRTSREALDLGRDTNRLTEDSIANAVVARQETRRSALELDKRWRREESMRMLRWAAEQATSGNQRSAEVAVAVLEALETSEMVQVEDSMLVTAVIDALLAAPEDAYDGAKGRSERGPVPGSSPLTRTDE